MTSGKLKGPPASQGTPATPREQSSEIPGTLLARFHVLPLQEALVRQISDVGKVRLDFVCPNERSGISLILGNMKPEFRENGSSHLLTATTTWPDVKALLLENTSIVFMDPDQTVAAPFLIEGTAQKMLFADQEPLLDTIERMRLKN